MASIYDLKPVFQGRLRPLAGRLAARGVTANQVTIAAFVLSAISGTLIALWPGAVLPLLLMPAALFARMALNAIDGMLAREHGQATRPGASRLSWANWIAASAHSAPKAISRHGRRGNCSTGNAVRR